MSPNADRSRPVLEHTVSGPGLEFRDGCPQGLAPQVGVSCSEQGCALPTGDAVRVGNPGSEAEPRRRPHAAETTGPGAAATRRDHTASLGEVFLAAQTVDLTASPSQNKQSRFCCLLKNSHGTKCNQNHCVFFLSFHFVSFCSFFKLW